MFTNRYLNKLKLNIPGNKLLLGVIIISIILCLSFLENFIFLIPVIILFSVVVYFWKTPAIVLGTIIMFVALPGEIDPNFRLIVNIFAIGLLIVTYLYEFGLNFNPLLSVSDNLNYLVIILLLSIILSSVYNMVFQLGMMEFLRSIVFFFVIYLYLLFVVIGKFARELLIWGIIISSLIVSVSIFYSRGGL